MNKIVPFKMAHLDIIEIREHEQQILDLNKLNIIADMGNCFTFICDGRIITVYGFYFDMPGVLQVFLIPSIYVKQYAKTFLKYIKSTIQIPKVLEAHRVQTISRANEETDRWMEYLGFVCEGTLINYIMGEDYRMWAITDVEGA